MKINFFLSKLLTYSFYYLTIIPLVSSTPSKTKTYQQLQDADVHPQRIRNFYKKAVNMLSQGRLHAAVSHFGVGTFCDKDFKPNEVVMEIPGNYTISSFDFAFPYLQEIEPIFNEYLQKNIVTIEGVQELRFVLNLNWVRYIEDSNRFFRIFFNNLPRYKNSLLFWDRQEKQILQKLTNDPLIEKDLLFRNSTGQDFLIEDIKRILRKKDVNLPMKILSDERVEEALDILYTRTLTFSLKGWKLIHNKTSDLEEEDKDFLGVVLIPGADAINHENIPPTHPDVDLTQVKFEKGKVVVKAGRNYKTGEELTINYDARETVFGLFRRYGFVPLEAINNNMIFRNDYIDMSKAPKAGKLVCLALGACSGDEKGDIFRVPKFTNQFDLAHLVIERLNYWHGPPFVEEKMFEIYNQIVRHQHSNYTEGMALSKFAHSFYGLLLYSSNFKTDISTILSLYKNNEESMPITKNLELQNLAKLKVNKDSSEIRDRFREILKYCLVNQHIIALNTRESIRMMNTALDNLFLDLKRDIVEQTS